MAAQPSPTTSADNVQTVAYLTLEQTTVTATVPYSTSGVAVVDGTTLSFRHDGITLSDGEVFSLGFDGLVASTTTASYEFVSMSTTTPSVRYDSTRHPTGTSIILTNSQDLTSSLPPDTPLTPTTSSSSSTGMTSSQASSESESSSGMTTTMPSSSSTGAQEGPGNSNAAPLTTNGGSGAPAQAQHVGFGQLFVAGLGLLVTFGAMVGL